MTYFRKEHILRNGDVPVNNRSFGRIGENSAALYLEKKGFNIVGRNVYVGRFEIDIIAENGELLLFVEVKTRRQTPDSKGCYGRPASAVNYQKRASLLSAVRRYLYENKENTRQYQPRIDIIEVYVDPASHVYRTLDIRHFPNAVHP